MGKKRYWPFVICLFVLFLLIGAAVLGYPRYGQGLGYVLCLILPAVYLASGLSSVWTSRWTWILTALSAGLLAYVYRVAGWALAGFLPWMAVYLSFGIAGGVCAGRLRG